MDADDAATTDSLHPAHTLHRMLMAVARDDARFALHAKLLDFVCTTPLARITEAQYVEALAMCPRRRNSSTLSLPRRVLELRLYLLERLCSLLNAEQVAQQAKVNNAHKQMDRVRKQRARDAQRTATTTTKARSPLADDTLAALALDGEEGESPTLIDQLAVAAFTWLDAHLPLACALEDSNDDDDSLFVTLAPSKRTAFCEGELPDMVDDVERLVVRSMCESINAPANATATSKSATKAVKSKKKKNAATPSAAASTRERRVESMRWLIDKCLPQRCHVREVAAAVETEIERDSSVCDTVCALLAASLLGSYEHARRRCASVAARKQLFRLFLLGASGDDNRRARLAHYLQCTIRDQSSKTKAKSADDNTSSCAAFQSVLVLAIREYVLRALRQRPGARAAIVRMAPNWFAWERSVLACANQMRGSMALALSEQTPATHPLPWTLASVVCASATWRLPDNSLVPMPLEPFCESLLCEMDAHLDAGHADLPCHAAPTPECITLMRIAAAGLPLTRGAELLPVAQVVENNDDGGDEDDEDDDVLLKCHLHTCSMVEFVSDVQLRERLVRWPRTLARLRRIAFVVGGNDRTTRWQARLSTGASLAHVDEAARRHQCFPLYAFGAAVPTIDAYMRARERYLVSQSASAAKAVLVQFVTELVALDRSGFQYLLMREFARLSNEWANIYLMRLPAHMGAQQFSMLAASLGLSREREQQWLSVRAVRARLLRSFVCGQCKRFCGALGEPIVPAFTNERRSVTAIQQTTRAATAAAVSSAAAAALGDSDASTLTVAPVASAGGAAVGSGTGSTEIRIVWSTPASRLLAAAAECRLPPTLPLWSPTPTGATIADTFAHWRLSSSTRTSVKYSALAASFDARQMHAMLRENDPSWSMSTVSEVSDALPKWCCSSTTTTSSSSSPAIATLDERARQALDYCRVAETQGTALPEVRSMLIHVAIMSQWSAIGARSPMYAHFTPPIHALLDSATAASLAPDWPKRSARARWVCASRSSKTEAKRIGAELSSMEMDDDEDDDEDEDVADQHVVTLDGNVDIAPPLHYQPAARSSTIVRNEPASLTSLSCTANAITEREVKTALRHDGKHRRRERRRAAECSACEQMDLLDVDLLGFALVVHRRTYVACARCLAFVELGATVDSAQWRGAYIECGSCRRLTTQLVAGLGATATDALTMAGRRAHGAARATRLTPIEAIAVSRPRCMHCNAVSVLCFDAIDDVSGRPVAIGTCEADASRMRPFLTSATMPLLSIIEDSVVPRGRARESNSVASTNAVIKRATTTNDTSALVSADETVENEEDDENEVDDEEEAFAIAMQYRIK